MQLKNEDISIGLVFKDWNYYQTALNHAVIKSYMDFHIIDYTKFISELHKRSVIDYKQLKKILKYLLEYNAKYDIKLHLLETIACIQQSVKNDDVEPKNDDVEHLKIFIDVLKSHKELQPLAYFLLEWIAKCKIAHKKGNNTQNSYCKYQYILFTNCN